jgi:hypothetical protein
MPAFCYATLAIACGLQGRLRPRLGCVPPRGTGTTRTIGTTIWGFGWLGRRMAFMLFGYQSQTVTNSASATAYAARFDRQCSLFLAESWPLVRSRPCFGEARRGSGRANRKAGCTLPEFGLRPGWCSPSFSYRSVRGTDQDGFCQPSRLLVSAAHAIAPGLIPRARH